MILRSVPNQQSQNYPIRQQQSINVRDIMRENDLSSASNMNMNRNSSNNNILTGSITGNVQNASNPNYDRMARDVINQIIVCPPSHIQSQTEISLTSDGQDRTPVRRLTPRRRKIFNDTSQMGQPNFKKIKQPVSAQTGATSMNPNSQNPIKMTSSQGPASTNYIKNAGSINNTPSFGQGMFILPQQPPKMNQFRQQSINSSIKFSDGQNNRMSQSLQAAILAENLGLKGQINKNTPTPTIMKMQSNPNPSIQAFPSSNMGLKNSSGAYDNDQSSIYNTVKSMTKKQNNTVYQRQQSEPSMLPAEPSGISLKSRHQSLQTTPNAMFNAPRISKVGSLASNDASSYHTLKNVNPSQNPRGAQSVRKQNNIQSLGKTVLQKPPVPVYQSQFYGAPHSLMNDSFNNQKREQQSKAYQPYYTNANTKNNFSPSFNDGNYENNRDEMMMNNPLLNAMLADYKKRQTMNNSLNPNSNNNVINYTQTNPNAAQQHPLPSPMTTSNVNPVPDTRSAFSYHLHHQENVQVDPTRPFLGKPNSANPLARSQSISTPAMPTNFQNMNNFASLSPIEESEKQELRFIPKKFQLIEYKVKKQEQELMEIARKLAENKVIDLSSQKALLQQLIQKQHQLTQKQRQINSNLEHLKMLQTQQSMKKQRILKYELELQQSKRIQELYKQNQRLYQQLMRRQNPQNQSFATLAALIQLQQKRKAVSSGPTQLLSPFSINPSLF